MYVSSATPPWPIFQEESKQRWERRWNSHPFSCCFRFSLDVALQQESTRSGGNGIKIYIPYTHTYIFDYFCMYIYIHRYSVTLSWPNARLSVFCFLLFLYLWCNISPQNLNHFSCFVFFCQEVIEFKTQVILCCSKMGFFLEEYCTFWRSLWRVLPTLLVLHLNRT